MPVFPPWTFPVPAPDRHLLSAPSSEKSGLPEEAPPAPPREGLERLRRVFGAADYAWDEPPVLVNEIKSAADPRYGVEPIKRFNETLHQAPRTQRAEDRQVNVPNQSMFLAVRYRNMVASYAAVLGAPQSAVAPLALENLTLSRGLLRFFYRTASGAPRTVTLTEENAKTVFRHLKIPYSPTATPDLLQQMTELLSQMDFNPWEEALREVIRSAPQAADLCRALRNACSWFDGHLIGMIHPPHSDPNVLVPDAISELRYPILFGNFSPETRSRYRDLLQALLRDHRQKESDERTMLQSALAPKTDLLPLTDRHILFLDIKKGYLFFYDRETKTLTLRTEDQVSYPHTQKYLFLPSEIRLDKGSPRSLYFLTGGDPTAVDETAAILSRMAAAGPGERQLSVILTDRNALALRDYLTKLFGGRVFPQTVEQTVYISDLLKGRRYKPAAGTPADQPPWQIACSRAHLLAEQTRGTFLLFVDERLPSPGREGVFLDLIRGKKLDLPDDLLPGQTFHNQLHVVYITGDKTLAETLVRKFNAHLLDLRPHELFCPMNKLPTQEEIYWVQRYLLPWGLIKQQKHRRKKLKKALSRDALAGFLADQCRFSRKLRCPWQEVYDAYRAYYKKWCGKDCPDTSVQFGKRLRAALPPNVEYKVARYGQGKLGLCYVGLGLWPDCRAKPEESNPGDVLPEGYRSHLREIEEAVLPIYEGAEREEM